MTLDAKALFVRSILKMFGVTEAEIIDQVKSLVGDFQQFKADNAATKADIAAIKHALGISTEIVQPALLPAPDGEK